MTDAHDRDPFKSLLFLHLFKIGNQQTIRYTIGLRRLRGWNNDVVLEVVKQGKACLSWA